MRVVAIPDQRVRVDRCRVVHGNAPQAVLGGPRRGGAGDQALVEPADLLTANARFESTTWSASVVGPTLGGAAIGLFGPVVTMPPTPSATCSPRWASSRDRWRRTAPPPISQRRLAGLAEGWRYILHHRQLRRLFFNVMTVNGLIMAGEAPLAVLMLGQLGFRPWQYGLAFAVPCAGGLIGSRLARPLAARYGTAPGHARGRDPARAG